MNNNAVNWINNTFYELASNQTNDDEEQKCTPFLDGNKLGSKWSCTFVRENLDICEGGGYVLWTELILCEASDFKRVLFLILAIITLFYLFVMITSSADEFFSKNIANLVDEHNISQSTAGVTFMAFGNGAPDIFSSIASVISTKRPKANLAVAELLGGGIFVTTIVIATIIFVKPFKVAGLPFLRDAGFYLLALGWLTFIMLFSKQLFVWEPIFFIALYLIYVATVLLTRLLTRHLRTKKHDEQKNKTTRASSKISELSLDFTRIEHENGDYLRPPAETANSTQMERALPSPNIVYPLVKHNGRRFSYNSIDTVSQRTDSTARTKNALKIDNHPARKHSAADHSWALPTVKHSRNLSIMSLPRPHIATGLVVPQIVLDLVDENQPIAHQIHEGPYLESGKFFMDPEMSDDDDIDDSDARSIASTTMTLQADKPVTIADALRSRAQSTVIDTPIAEDNFCAELLLLLKYMSPIDVDEFKEGSHLEKVIMIIKIPCMIVFKLTIPIATQTWFKLLAILHIITAPMTFLFAFQIHDLQVFAEKLQLWMLILPISLIIALLVGVFTKFGKAPSHFRKVISYFGFIISTAWIYAIAAEVVSIVLMIGVVSKISFDILGLTLIAWSNSLGDLIADYSVAKQGYSKMAIGAAIGGPLFNLMIGFGISFLIAKLQGKHVTVKMSPILQIMIIALAISLISSIIILTSQRFQARRFHSAILVLIYLAFIVVVILNEVNVLF